MRRGKWYLADLRGVVDQLAVVYPLLVLDQVVSQRSVGQVLHDQTQVPAAYGGGGD